MATKAKQTKETTVTATNDVKFDLLQGLLIQISLNDIYKPNYNLIRNKALEAYPELKYVYEAFEFILNKLSANDKQRFMDNPEHALLSLTSVSVVSDTKQYTLELRDVQTKASSGFIDDLFIGGVTKDAKWIRTVYLRNLYTEVQEFIENCERMSNSEITVLIPFNGYTTVEYKSNNE